MLRTARGVGTMLVAIVAIGVTPAAAGAEVVPGRPDESIQQAYPVGPGHWYAGAFDDSGYDDVDYLAFQVSQPGQTLEFTIANTTQQCVDPNDAGCPVYATLMDSTDQQVGGDSSEAGTIATSGDTEVFDWTFSSPGTYYLLMESNGDEAPGNPSYSVSFDAPAAGGSGTGGTGAGGATAPIVKSLTVPRRQRGTAVSARLVLGQPAVRVLATLFAPGRRPSFVARLERDHLTAGAHTLKLRLSAGYRRRLKRNHHLWLRLKLTAIDAAGQQTKLSRYLTLSAAGSP